MKEHSPLTPIAEARQQLLSAFTVLEKELVPLGQAANRVLAETIFSKINLPAFDNSSMDGFAVRAADTLGARADQAVDLKVVADIPAGQAPAGRVDKGQAARIMTGAALPPGADAVVPVEDTDFGVRSAGTPAPKQVQIFRAASVGANVRPRGQDLRAGEQVLSPHMRLQPQDVGVLAMLGQSQVPVYRRPRVGLLFPGDELLPVDTPLVPGKIYESNSYVLDALVVQNGGQTSNLGIVPDNLDAVRQSLDEMVAQGVDLLLSTGGVSVGAFDFVRAILEQEGNLQLWRVNMKPGKPLAFGDYQSVPYIGLPGNPVSAYVGFQVFVRPALWKMAGLPDSPRVTRQVKLLEPIESGGRETYLRAIVTHDGEGWFARLTGHQGSGNLRSLVQANALIIIPAGVTSLQSGDDVEAWFFEGVHE
jgi:molybdopterin molybdotransferase